MSLKEKEKKDGEQEKPKPIKTAAELQRMKLEKLMKNFDKPVVIPERPKEKLTPHVPDFVRNVMGSSAGAGSGEFHVYRHLRRKEYARQKFIELKGKKELEEEKYHEKIAENERLAEERTAKKRAKRLKKKEKMKNRKKRPKVEIKEEPSESSSENEDVDIVNDEKEEDVKVETIEDIGPEESKVKRNDV